MRIAVIALFTMLLIGKVGFTQKTLPPLPPPPPKIGAYDTTILQGYIAEKIALKEREEKLVAALLAEIRNTAHPELKERLILLLGDFDNEEATRFLVNNLTYRSRYVEEGGVEASFMHLPCLMALISKKSLHALPFIEEYLRECRTNREITLLYMVLSNYIVKLRLDIRWIKEMTPSVPENTCKEKNVERLISHLKQNRFIR